MAAAIGNTKTHGRRASVVAKPKRSNHQKLKVEDNARIHALGHLRRDADLE